ncbi:CoA pyrophosphatase, partial [Anaeromyxobacter sp. SG66]
RRSRAGAARRRAPPMSLAALRTALAARAPGLAPLDEIRPGAMPPGGFLRAAVLVPLHAKDDAPHVLLTRRTRHLRRHPGQISFPGGRVDPEEEHLAAALREAREEIGLDPAQAEVMGRLSETLVLTSAFCLTPWVATVPYPYPYAAAAHEVEEILHVPFAALLAPGAHRTERAEAWGLPVDVHFFSVGGDTIWGATARILAELLSIWRTL